MLTKNGIGNLINRYKAVLKKCHLLNTFGSLAVAGMLIASDAHVAMAADVSLGVNHDLTIGTGGDLEAGDRLGTSNLATGDYTLTIQNNMTGTDSLDRFTIGIGPATQAGDITVTLQAGNGTTIETGSLSVQSGTDGTNATRSSTYTISSGTTHIATGDVYLTSGDDYTWDSGIATLRIADGGTLVLQNTNNFINNAGSITSNSILDVQGNLHSLAAAGTAAADLSLEGITTTFAENAELIALGLTATKDTLDGANITFNQNLITVDADYTGITPIANTIQSLTITGSSDIAFRSLHADGNIALGGILREEYGNLDVYREYTDTANAVIDMNTNSIVNLETRPNFMVQGAYDLDANGTYDTVLSFSNLTIDPAQILSGSATTQAGQITLNNKSTLKTNNLHFYKAGTSNHTLNANTTGTHENYISTGLLNVLGAFSRTDGALTALSPLIITGTGSVGDTTLNAATITAGAPTSPVTFDSNNISIALNPYAGGGLINADLLGNNNASYFSVDDGTWRMDSDNVFNLDSAGLYIESGIFHDNDRTLSANAFTDGSVAPAAGQIAIKASGSGAGPMYYANNLTLEDDGAQTLGIGAYSSSFPSIFLNGTVGAEHLTIINTADRDADNLTINSGTVLVHKSLTADMVTLADDNDTTTITGLILGSDYAMSGGTLNTTVQVEGANAMLVQRGTWEALKNIDIDSGTLTIDTGAVLNTTAATLSVTTATGTVSIADRAELIANQSDFGIATTGGTIGAGTINLDGRLTIANGWDGTNTPSSLATLQSTLASISAVNSAGLSIDSGLNGVIRLEGFNVSTDGLTLDSSEVDFNFSLPNNTLGAGQLGDASAGNAYHVEIQGLRGDALSTIDSESMLTLLGGSTDTVLAEGDIQLNDDTPISAGTNKTRLTLGTGTMAQHDVILGSADPTSLIDTELLVIGHATVGNITQGDGDRSTDGDVEGELRMAHGAALTVLGNADVQTVNIENTSTNTIASLYVGGDLTVGDTFGSGGTTGSITTSGNTTVMGEMKLHMWGEDEQYAAVFDEISGTTTVGSLVLNPEQNSFKGGSQILQMLDTTTVTTGGINGDAKDLNAAGRLNAQSLIKVGNVGEQGILQVDGAFDSEAAASDLIDLTFFVSSKWNPTEMGTSWIADAYNASYINFVHGFEDNSGATTNDNVMRGTLVMGQNSMISTGHIDDNNTMPLMMVELPLMHPQWYGDHDKDGLTDDANAILWGTDYYDTDNTNNITAALYINNFHTSLDENYTSANASIDLTTNFASTHGTIIVDGSLLRADDTGTKFYNSDESTIEPLYQIVDLGTATDPNHVERGSAIFGHNSLLMVDANGVRYHALPEAANTYFNGVSTFLKGPGELRVADTSRLHIREGYAGQKLQIAMAKGNGTFWQGLGYNSANPHATQITTDTALLKVNHINHTDPGITGSNGNYTITLQQVAAKEAFPLFTDATAAQIDQFMRDYGLNYDKGTALEQYISRAVSYYYGLGAATPQKARETVESIEGAMQTSSVGGVSIAAINAATSSSAATIARNVMGNYSHGGQNVGSVTVGENGEISTGIPAGDEASDAMGMKNGLGLWLMPMYKWSSVSGQGGGTFDHGYDTGLAGLALGMDYSFSEMFRIGLSFNLGTGYTESTGDYNATENDFDFFGVGLYAAFRKNGFGLIGDVGYTSVFNQVTQETAPGMELGDSTIDMPSEVFTAGLTAEYVFKTNAVDIIPHVGVRFMSVMTPEHEVRNNGPLFEVEADTQNVWYFPLGIAFQKDIELGDGSSGWHFTPKLDLGVIIASGDLHANSNVTMIGLEGKSSFEMQNVDEFAFNGGIGLDFGNENLTFGLNYNLLASEHETGHMIFGTFRYEF